MNAYLVLCLIIIFLALIFYQDVNNQKFIGLAFLALFVVYGLRDALSIGIDSSGYGLYYGGFKQAGQLVISLSKNFGFFYLEKIVNILTNGNYQIFVTLIATFVTYSYYRLVKKYSDNSYISIMWFMGMLYYIFMFSALKQSIAMAILTWAFDAAMEKKRVKFYLLVIVAACFHVPAIIFLPVFLLSKVRINKLFLINLVALFAVVFIFRLQILELMTSFYENGEELATGDVRFFGNKVIYMVIIIVLAVAFRPQDNGDDRYFSTLINLMAIAAVLQTFCYYSNMFERLADYYYQFSVLFIPLVIKNINERPYKSSKIAGACAVLVVTVFCVWRFNNYVCDTMPMFFLPYKFLWQ